MIHLNQICGACYCDGYGSSAQTRGNLQMQWDISNMVFAHEELLHLQTQSQSVSEQEAEPTAAAPQQLAIAGSRTLYCLFSRLLLRPRPPAAQQHAVGGAAFGQLLSMLTMPQQNRQDHVVIAMQAGCLLVHRDQSSGRHTLLVCASLHSSKSSRRDIDLVSAAQQQG